MAPVAEPEGIPLRVTSHHGDKGESEQDKDKDYFPTGKPEFGFAIAFDGQSIQTTVDTRLST
jgi:hypothetical protein